MADWKIVGDGAELREKTPAHICPDHSQHPIVAFAAKHHRGVDALFHKHLSGRCKHFTIDAIKIGLAVQVLHAQDIFFREAVARRQYDDKAFLKKRHDMQAFVR